MPPLTHREFLVETWRCRQLEPHPTLLPQASFPEGSPHPAAALLWPRGGGSLTLVGKGPRPG